MARPINTKGLYKQPGSDNWHFEFVIQGIRIRQSSGTSDVKAAFAERDRVKAEEKKRIEGGFGRMTLKDAFVKYGTSHIARGTSDGKNYKANARRICDGLGEDTALDDLNTAVINDWAEKLFRTGKRVNAKGAGMLAKRVALHGKDAGLKVSTVNTYLKLLRTVLRKAHRTWRTLVHIPAIEMLVDGKKDKRVKALTRAQADALIFASPRYLRDYLEFLFDTGARKMEAVQLNWNNVNDLLGNAERASVTFGEDEAAGQAVKTEGSARTIKLPHQTRELLVRMRKMQEANGVWSSEGPVFMFKTKAGKWQRLNAFYGAFWNACERAKMPEWVVVHTTRHTYASLLLKARVPLIEVSRLLGHASLKMTADTYSHFQPDDLDQAVAALDRAA